MKKESCENCKYIWDTGLEYQCRANTPERVSPPISNASWPIVRLHDWCGKWFVNYEFGLKPGEGSFDYIKTQGK